MLHKNEILVRKNDLIESHVYKEIRDLQLKHILTLSNSDTDSVLIKGMLKLVHDTDKWRDDFQRQKNKDIKNG